MPSSDRSTQSVAAGATLAAGGTACDGPGSFYEPTVLLDTGPGMPAFDEETFGPVAAIAVAADEDDAVRLANATPYGLGLSVWSRSTDRALAVARRVTSGAAFVNAVVASDPRVPFGGTKRSGYGRELAEAGILEFTNQRTYWVAQPDRCTAPLLEGNSGYPEFPSNTWGGSRLACETVCRVRGARSRHTSAAMEA